MKKIKRSAEKGRIKEEDILPMYATQSKIVSCCLQCSSITVMYYSADVVLCAIATTTAIFTETGGKLWAAYGVKTTMNDMIAVAKDEAKATMMQRMNSATAEPGVRAMLRVSGTSAAVEMSNPNTNSNEMKEGEELIYQEELDKKVLDMNWDLTLGMLAARWYSEIAAEKTLILVAAFFVWSLDLVDGLPQMKLLRIMVIFFGGEFVADIVLLYSLERWYGLPFSRLPGYKTKREFFAGVFILSLQMAGLAMGIMIVDDFIETTL